MKAIWASQENSDISKSGYTGIWRFFPSDCTIVEQ